MNLCETCRSSWSTSRKIAVTTEAPRALWLRGESSDPSTVPPLPVHVTVKRWPGQVLARLSEGQRSLTAKRTGKHVKTGTQPRRLAGWGPLWWKDTVKELTFDWGFNQPITGVVWPASLLQLSFGGDFNQPIVGVSWPASLQQLRLGIDYIAGGDFNQPIAGVVWPASLKRLYFGLKFNKPVIGVVWPAVLQELSFGTWFNQPIVGVSWPASLQQLRFGNAVRGVGDFNQPIAGVEWPASLQQLSFGNFFNQPIAGVVWPAGLQQLSLGPRFKQPTAGVVWPASLRHAKCGAVNLLGKGSGHTSESRSQVLSTISCCERLISYSCKRGSAVTCLSHFREQYYPSTKWLEVTRLKVTLTAA